MNDEQMVRVRSVEPLDGFRVRLGFTDGSSKEIDLDPYLRGPVFEPIRKDAKMFREVSVDQRAGTIGATPAIVNAIVDALSPYGVKHLDMPVRPEAVWKLIRNR